MKKRENKVPLADFYMRKRVECVKSLVLLSDNILMLAGVLRQNPSIPEMDKILRMVDRMNKSMRKAVLEHTISLS